LLTQACSAAVDTGGERWTLRDGKLERARDLFSEIQRAVKRTRALERRDMAFKTFLARHVDRLISLDARRFARSLAEGFDAAHVERASARAIVAEWAGGNSLRASQYRPMRGYGPLLDTLAAELRYRGGLLQLDTPIDLVRWTRQGVEVRGSFLGRAFDARAHCAVITLPLGVLQHTSRAGGLRFAPTLSQKRDALALLAPGPVYKVLLRFRTPFWEKLDDRRYADAAFFHAPGAVFPTFWTSLPVRTPLLVAWAAGPNADRLAGVGEKRIIAEALRSFGALFGRADACESSLESAWVHDWQRDPYARGAYTYVKVGGENAASALAQPLEDVLFFAGEATDTQGEVGTVTGALQSGRRAAEQVMSMLGRS
jgi:monoamine oxidase